MLKSYDEAKERHEVRLEYLQYRASYHLKMVTEEKDHVKKCYHWRTFEILNKMYQEEKNKKIAEG